MNSLPRFVVAAVLLAASAAGRAQSIAELPEDKFKSLVEKTALYTKALGAARAIQKSYDQYASWVDIKAGPTGKEKKIDGLTDIESAAQEISEAASKGPGMWPPLPSIDLIAEKMAAATKALAPVVKSASDYYAQKKYKADAAKQGQELHAKLVPMFEEVFKTQLAMRGALSVVLQEVEQRNLAQIEKEHGKNYDWHLRSFLIAAKDIAELLPNNTAAATIESARYRTRFAALQAAYTAFSQYCVEHPAEAHKAVLATSLDDFFAATRILRGVLEAPKPDHQVYVTKVSDLAAKYDILIQRTTTTTAAR